MKKKKIMQFLLTAIKIIAGGFLYALAVNWLFEPNALSVGGFSGIAQIVHKFVPAIPIGIAVLVMNIPLFAIGIKKQGVKLLVGSMCEIVICSVFVDLLASVRTWQPMDNPILACIVGGVLLGASIGLPLSVGASTGGSDLMARLLKYRFPHISIGRLCLVIDAVVVLLYSLAYKSLSPALYSMVTLYIGSLVTDAVVYGGQEAKLALIISDHTDGVRAVLLEENLGVTVINASGGYTGERKNVFLCAFRRNQIARIKAAITSVDPGAFLILCKAHEVLGEGFGTYSADGL